MIATTSRAECCAGATRPIQAEGCAPTDPADLDEARRPGARERLAQVGAECLSDAELIALLLGTGSRDESVTVLAARLLATGGGLVGLARMRLGELKQLQGLGDGKAGRLLGAFELGRRVVSQPLARGRKITSSADVFEALGPKLAAAEVERFIAIPLDARNRPLGEIVMAVGGLSQCPVSPADVYRALLREAASAVIFVHNHPSGEPSPSGDDLALTERLVLAGGLLGVRVLDHVIVAGRDYFSFRDSGLLRAEGDEP
jgi:DNA repair protein RadC